MISEKIGICAISNFDLIVFDLIGKEKIRPYICKILGRDFKFGFKREFLNRDYSSSFNIEVYEKIQMRSFIYKLEPNYIYEYKRFPSETLGEIEEGYFAITRNVIKFLTYEQVGYWCSTFKEKEKKKDMPISLFIND